MVVKKDSDRDGKMAREFQSEVGTKAARKKAAREEGERGPWFGLGMFGLVGWSVAIPTLAGIALGVWIDSTWAGPRSWTLMGLILGVVVGCLNAWFWIERERRRDE